MRPELAIIALWGCRRAVVTQVEGRLMLIACWPPSAVGTPLGELRLAEPNRRPSQ